MSKPIVKVLYSPGTNSHQETMWAFERVGAKPELLFVSDVLAGHSRLDDGDLLCIPGGFTHGDHTGAGNVTGQLLRRRLGDQLESALRKPVIAICNGFQIAVRAGLFGGAVSLTVNEVGTFRNIVRQPHLVPANSANVWTSSLSGQTLHFPCAHGEGRFVYTPPSTSSQDDWKVALEYPTGTNPDGSTQDIAGIVSPDGLLFGLMNHPERLPDEPGNLEIFANGVKAARI